ncbi:MAG: hypothetical protein C5B45_02230 [Chlamydiae bacterium]|nr:MAG: hypothetical protein C5B45_02230 [Chlamydiota bacterium]
MFEPSRSTDCDYENSGYSRGHNAPAMDFKNSQALMDETFLTSNLCPQSKKENSGT